MSTTLNQFVDTSDREITTTRILNAPRDLVFEVWTDPKHIAKWWGPYGFTSTINTMEVKPNGKWSFIMHGPDGTDFQNEIIYREVVKPEKLVYDQLLGVHFHVTVTFAEEGNKTRLTMQVLFDTAEERDRKVKEVRAIEGQKQTLNRLEAYLTFSGRANNSDELLITRVLNAPRDLVFSVWTEPKHLAQWWGPKGFTMNKITMNLQPGGTFHYAMNAPSGEEMWGKFVFQEVTKPEQLAFVSSFSDEQGNVTRHPLSATWPLETFNQLTLTEENGKTTLTLRGGPINATEEERQTFEGARHMVEKGFEGTFEQLVNYLEQL